MGEGGSNDVYVYVVSNESVHIHERCYCTLIKIERMKVRLYTTAVRKAS